MRSIDHQPLSAYEYINVSKLNLFVTMDRLQGGGVGPAPNSQPGGPGAVFVWPFTWNMPSKLDLPETGVPADLDSKVIKARKPPYHGKEHLIIQGSVILSFKSIFFQILILLPLEYRVRIRFFPTHSETTLLFSLPYFFLSTLYACTQYSFELYIL